MADIKSKTIASPKLVSKFSPINKLVNNLTVNTGMGGALKKYTQNKNEDIVMAESDSNGQVEEDKTNSIPISNFKSNKLSHIDKQTRMAEFEKMINSQGEPQSPMIHDAIRLPNKINTSALKGAAAIGGST